MVRLKHIVGRFSCLLFVAIIFCVPLNLFADQKPLEIFRLVNGMKVIVKPEPGRHLVSVQLWVKVGSADETESERGISHVIEHMAFKGTPTRGAGEIAQEVESLGGTINAVTNRDYTLFFVTVPSKALINALDLILDAVLNPIISPDELEKEKQVVIEEILSNEDSPALRASRFLWETAYTRSPYRFPVTGSVRNVGQFSRDQIMAFREKWYVPQNMFIVIVGDVQASVLRPELERLTRKLATVEFSSPARSKEPRQDKIRASVTRDPDAHEARLYLAFRIPGMRSPDLLALDLVSHILGRGRNSLLAKGLKQDRQLVRTTYSELFSGRDSGLFIVAAVLPPENVLQATAAIVRQIETLGMKGPSVQHLRRAKIRIESGLIHSDESVERVASRIGTFEINAGDARYEQEYRNKITYVTEHSIAGVVRKYLSPPRGTVAVALPAKQHTDFTSAQLIHSVTDSWTVGSADHDPISLDRVLESRLQNGMRVILARDHNRPLVAFSIVGRGGRRFETEESQGVMNFVARMITKGTTNRSETEITESVEDLGGRLRAFAGYDTIGISASFLSRNIEPGLILLADVYSSPSFPKETVESERNRIASLIASSPYRAYSFAVDKLHETLFLRHPYRYGRFGSMEACTRLTREDLIRAHKMSLIPRNTILVGVGDMEMRKTMALVSEIFGRIQGTDTGVNDIVPEPAIRSPRARTFRVPGSRAQLFIGFHGASFSNPDRYAMEVLCNACSGQGGILFQQLRERQSLAYTLGCLFRPGRDHGILAFYVSCDPRNADRALDSLRREIERIRVQGISQCELTRAKNNLIGTHLMSQQISTTRAKYMALHALYGLGTDYHYAYGDQIAKVTASHVNEVARKYLLPSASAITRVLPKE